MASLVVVVEGDIKGLLSVAGLVAVARLVSVAGLVAVAVAAGRVDPIFCASLLPS